MRLPGGSLDFNGNATANPALPYGYSSGSGNSLADLLLGSPASATANVALGFGEFRATDQFYYIDDTWQISPKVTITMGLRYENVPPYYDKSGKLVNIAYNMAPYGTVDAADQPTLVRIGQGNFYQGLSFRFNPDINVARNGELGSRLVYPDNTNFAPRLGLAWSPSDKWTVRLGAGTFYDQDIAAMYFDMSRNLAATQTLTSSTTFPNLNISSLPLGGLTINTPQILGVQPNRRTPYTNEWTANIQRQLTSHTMLEVVYLGTEAHRLEMFDPINEPAASPLPNPASRFPFPELAHSWVQAGIGNSNYEALSAMVGASYQQGSNADGGVLLGPSRSI